MAKKKVVVKPETTRNRDVYSPAKIDARIRNAMVKVIQTHGDRYDYKHFADDYKNAKTPVRIICSIHGEFKQTPDAHISGNGCKDCGKIKLESSFDARRKSTETFLQECFAMHGDTFDYSKTVYTNSTTDIIIGCKVAEHGDFLQRPDHHLETMFGCPACTAANTGARNKVVLTNDYREMKSTLQREYLDGLDVGIETHHAIDPEDFNMNEWHVLKF